MPDHRSLFPMRRASAVAAVSALLLTGAVTACGSDGGSTSTTASSTTATSTGASAGGGGSQGGVPGDEGAIRAAIARAPAALKAAGTARVASTQTGGLVPSTSKGVVDLAGGRFLFDQSIGGGDGKRALKTESYGEKGRIYIRTELSKDWSTTDNPLQSGDPLAQFALLRKADITKVGGTSTYDGHECRDFDAEIGLKDVLSLVAPKGDSGLQKIPDGATVPVSACIDGSGLTYASKTTIDLKKVLGSSAGKLGAMTSTETLRISDYGSAPSPKRPAGIDDAKPLEGSGTP